jgi:hypothetical protein
MGTININFGDIKMNEPVPEGIYTVIIDEVTVRLPTDPKGSPYLNFILKVTSGEHEGRAIFMRNSLAEKALWRLVPVIQNFGMIPEGTALEEFLLAIDYSEETGQIFSPDFSGFVARVKVYHEDYQGRKNAQVGEVLPLEPEVSITKPPAAQASAMTLQPTIPSTTPAPKMATAPGQRINLK